MTGFKEYKSQELSWRVLKIVPQDFLGEAAKSSGYKSPPITVLIQFKAASPREINGMSCPLVKGRTQDLSYLISSSGLIIISVM